MKTYTTTLGLNDRDISVLLKIGLQQRSAPTHRLASLAQRWTVWLARPLPEEAIEDQKLPIALSEFGRRLGLLSQETIGDFLGYPHTDLTIVKLINRYAKQVSSCADTRDERKVNSTLYYLTIAHALVYHKRRITSFGYAKLMEQFQRLGAFRWLDEDSRFLFTKARKRCQKKLSSNG